MTSFVRSSNPDLIIKPVLTCQRDIKSEENVQVLVQCCRQSEDSLAGISTCLYYKLICDHQKLITCW